MEFARDLVMTGAIFGLATLIWAGWAQENPPGTGWRVVLAALSAAGLALLGFSIPVAITHWNTPSAIGSMSPALIAYIIVFWVEIIVCVALAVYFTRTKRPHLVAPLVLIVVGVHFVPLAFVFGQAVLVLAAVLATAAGIAALVLPRSNASPSFWCGILAAPVFVVLGTISLVAGATALNG